MQKLKRRIYTTVISVLASVVVLAAVISGLFRGAMLLAPEIAVIPSMTVADLRYNQLDTESAKMLVEVAKEKKISLCGIKPGQTEADFSPKGYHDPRMGPADAILLTADLAVIASMTALDVRGNQISGDGAKALSAAVLGNIKIEKFNDIPIKEEDRLFHWPAGRRPDDHASLSELGL